MRYLLSFLLSALFVLGCGQDQAAEKAANAEVSNEKPVNEQAALQKADPVGTYGKGISLNSEVPLKDLLKNPARYEGQEVVVNGTIVDVCPKRGCWIEMAGKQSFETIRVKVTDGEIVFPLSAKGNQASVQGVVQKIELSEKEAREWKKHEAEEKGESFDPASVQGPLTIWRLRGVGADIKG